MHKILVADDSLTIQKVIKITLANEDFEIIECLDSKDLESSVNKNSPDIVLLDFNLSEDKTGYELAEKILNEKPNIQLLMLFGTFDTIDESLMNQCGVKYKIVKPFDGTKFITLCHAMRDELLPLSDIPKNKNVTSIFDTNEIDEDEWVMDSPSVSSETPSDFVEQSVDTETDDSLDTNLRVDRLQASVEDWGIDVPGVIGKTEITHLEVPEVINTQEDRKITEQTIEETSEKIPEKIVLPEADDLEYPDIISSSDEPKLVPLDSFEEDEETAAIEPIPAMYGQDQSSDIDLESEIKDEIDSENLWTADEVEEGSEPFIPIEEDIPVIAPHKLVEVPKTPEEKIVDTSTNDSFDNIEFIDEAPSDFPADVMDEASSFNQKISQVKSEEPKESDFATTLTRESIEDLVKKKAEPILQEVVHNIVKEYCQANIEKIAWEVIPDLAENLIKKEIEKITKSILEP